MDQRQIFVRMSFHQTINGSNDAHPHRHPSFSIYLCQSFIFWVHHILFYFSFFLFANFLDILLTSDKLCGYNLFFLQINSQLRGSYNNKPKKVVRREKTLPELAVYVCTVKRVKNKQIVNGSRISISFQPTKT